ncbi:hypothetical protein M5X00_26390 [Paenibacillus alvei]|uniref:hypothetical protein n=1 Tax=Paenibacillus alvei TaxID=44250 RepID=UPI00028A2866|nr:hypothetical protein [Paenibacillus alvei]EJW14069.1 hypothetical protein PAV_141p01750 [Paenibacillus alvei DSM 29]MCY9544880.1 hypothetical protein [Paenibacillus alvei]MCY9707780.1 hypothetical protein [Paenibacillus alvei]MCY9757762.1 hypothetical protein [Paenibacillus alvei]MEC0082707.1 hypothetical protein [Paenibacillus alvei]
MNLYYVTYETSDDSSGYLQEFVVASSESGAEDAIINKFRGSGLSKNDIVATLVEVDGYTICVMPK